MTTLAPVELERLGYDLVDLGARSAQSEGDRVRLARLPLSRSASYLRGLRKWESPAAGVQGMPAEEAGLFDGEEPDVSLVSERAPLSPQPLRSTPAEKADLSGGDPKAEGGQA